MFDFMSLCEVKTFLCCLNVNCHHLFIFIPLITHQKWLENTPGLEIKHSRHSFWLNYIKATQRYIKEAFFQPAMVICRPKGLLRDTKGAVACDNACHGWKGGV